MNIVYFSDSFGDVTTTFIRNEVEYFNARHRVLYLCIRDNRSSFSKINVKELSISPSRIKTKLKWWLWKFDIRCDFRDSSIRKQLKNQLEVFKPQIIHLNFAYESLKFLDNIEIPSSVPIIMHFHGYGASKMLNKESYVRKIRKYLKFSNVYPVFVSEYMKTKLTGIGVSCNSGLLLRCGIDVNKFHVCRPQPDKYDSSKIFLQVSSMVEKKGHEFTLRAFALFLRNHQSSNHFKLILTGDGRRKGKLMSLARELGIHEFVEFVGFVTHEEAKMLMNNAHYFVHHSITGQDGDQEGIPTVIMEAMAMELPIISTWHSGIPELVEDGINGYLVNEKDVNTYAARLEDILKWKSCPQNRQKICSQYELNKHNYSLESYYRQLILSTNK